jgi:hypothetical protein
MRVGASVPDEAPDFEVEAVRLWLEEALDAHSHALNRELAKHRQLMLTELTSRLMDKIAGTGRPNVPSLVDAGMQTKQPTGLMPTSDCREKSMGLQPPPTSAWCVVEPDATQGTPAILDVQFPGVVQESTMGVISSEDDGKGNGSPDKVMNQSTEEADKLITSPSQHTQKKSLALVGSGGDIYTCTLDPDSTGPMKTLQDVVLGTKFELFFGFLILLNTIVMAGEVQYRGFNTGSKLGYEPWNPSWFRMLLIVIEWTLGFCFTVELLLKFIVLRVEFFIFPVLDGSKGPLSCRQQLDRLDLWNLLDFFIVTFFWIGTLGDLDLPIDPMLLRLARLGRLLRLLRLVRSIQAFDSLYLLTAAIYCSISALFWSAMLIVTYQIMIALILNQMLESYILDESNLLETRREVFRYFGTFSRALFSMFEITLGNFVPVSRLLMDHVSEWYIFFNILHKCIIGFAVVSVVRGVFMHETFKVAATDDNIMVAQKTRAKNIHREKMHRLFEIADTDGSMTLDRSEFAEICEDKTLKTWLASMELEIQDSAHVFSLITGVEEGQGDEDVDLSLDMLVNSMANFKGPARQMQLSEVRQDCKQLRRMLKDVHTSLCRNSTKGEANGSTKDEANGSTKDEGRSLMEDEDENL